MINRMKLHITSRRKGSQATGRAYKPQERFTSHRKGLQAAGRGLQATGRGLQATGGRTSRRKDLQAAGRGLQATGRAAERVYKPREGFTSRRKGL